MAAFVLAVLLWFNVTAGERQDQPVRTRLEFEVADSSWVPVRLPAEVTTIFQGRRSHVSRLVLDPPRIRYVVDNVTSPTMQLSLGPDMVAYDRSLSIRAIDVRPSSVELVFERRITKQVEVEPVVEASAAPGYVIVGDPALDPPAVTVRGTESEVGALGVIPTERLSLRNVARTESHRLVLQLPGELSSLSVEPRSVEVTIEVDSLLERSFDIPLRATGSAAGAVRLERDRVTVRVRGPALAVRTISARSLSATVRVDAVPQTPASLTVRLGFPEGVDASAVAQPARVTVMPLSQGPLPGDESETSPRAEPADTTDGATRDTTDAGESGP